MNISSIIVIPQPARVESVLALLRDIPGVEVASVSPEGKAIVTIEAEGDREMVNTYEFIAQLDGVMSTSMVFHQKENEPEAEISVAA